MSTLPPPSGGDFVPPPEGTHMAVCYRVVDLGTQQTEFQGQAKRQRKIMLSWELPDEKMDDGEPFSIHQRYTWSMHEKATLRQHLEAWRGRAFTDADFGATGFNIKNLLGVGCLIGVVHEAKNGKTYANIRSIAKLMKWTKAPPLHNTATYFWLDSFDPVIFGGFSQGLQTVIMKSPEYQEAIRKRNGAEHVSDEPPPPNGPDDYGSPGGDFDSEIPF